MQPLSDREDGPRLWLVFFGDGERMSWWDVFTRKGYRHVCAAAWYSNIGSWVFYDVSAQGTEITVLRENDPACDLRFGLWMASASLVLRFASRRDRRRTPAGFYCVGAIKSLLGIRSRALAPYGLAQHLLRLGAEKVDREQDVFEAEDAAGRSCRQGGA